MPDAAAVRSFALLRAWLACEGLTETSADDFEDGYARLQALAAPRAHPTQLGDSSWLRLWSALPPGARDLIVLRALGGLPLQRIAELQGRPLGRIEREWLLLGRRLSARDPNWPAALQSAFLDAAPEPPPTRRGLRIALATAAVICFGAALFAPELHRALLLDPAQQRLQAPPMAPPPVVEQVPLSAPEFELWADEVDFATLHALDFLLWRLSEGGGEVVFDSPAMAALPEAAAPGQALVGALPNVLPGAGELLDPAAPGSRRPDLVPAASDPAVQLIEVLAPPPDLSALQPWALQWPHLLPSQRAELQQRAQQWELLDEPARLRFEQRAQAFRELAPLARSELRERHARWRSFDAATRSTLRALEAGFARATPEQQATLRTQHQALPEAVRRGLLAGKSAELAELARDAFAFVPEDERERTLDLLRELGATEHGLLQRMARRLDPAARESLRSELLAADPAARASLIRERAAAVGLRAP